MTFEEGHVLREPACEIGLEVVEGAVEGEPSVRCCGRMKRSCVCSGEAETVVSP